MNPAAFNAELMPEGLRALAPEPPIASSSTSARPPLVAKSSRASQALKRSSLFLACLASFGLFGCGNTFYALQATSASNKLQEAHELNAEKHAPYEYYLASEHLKKAKSEAAEADYGDATNLAEAAEEYADKAIQVTREALRGAGR